MHLGADEQVILMTHDGPRGSATTQWTDQDGTLTFGFQCLSDLLLKQKNRILFNVHGHCHDGAFQCALNNEVQVYNPGSLKNGKFASISIIKHEGKWKMLSAT